MRIALFNRLKKRVHREIALLQDEVIDVVYSVYPNAVLHGGTAIWRCYLTNRFSEDLDFYLLADDKFKRLFVKTIEARGLSLLKYKKTKNTVFSKISNGTVEVRFEAALRKVKGFEPKQFERVDGTFMDVFTLSPKQLVLEKIETYSNRRLVRDFYDIYVLSSMVSSNKKINEKMKVFLKQTKKPVDEKNLRVIVFSGAIPSFEQMRLVLKRRFKT